MAARVTRIGGGFVEGEALAAFAREGLTASGWSNGPGDTYAQHSHGYHKILYCLRGSITFQLVETGEAFELHPGDRLDIEPGTPHSAIVGADGVECAEAARSS
jgi:quercetin dioxygenase-like cupin family protein